MEKMFLHSTPITVHEIKIFNQKIFKKGGQNFDPTDQLNVQRGAEIYVNYCLFLSICL